MACAACVATARGACKHSLALAHVTGDVVHRPFSEQVAMVLVLPPSQRIDSDSRNANAAGAGSVATSNGTPGNATASQSARAPSRSRRAHRARRLRTA